MLTNKPHPIIISMVPGDTSGMIESADTLHRIPSIMGILNATPDSFYSESRVTGGEQLKKRIESMIAEGVDIIDVGGESSRPGAEYIDIDEELSRVIPVIRQIRELSDIPISIDTRKGETAREAAAAGATIINDISGCTDDPHMFRIAGEAGISIVIMHMQGNPLTMQENPQYNDPIGDIMDFLGKQSEKAVTAGIGKEKIIIDPGIGFGKTLDHNIAIFKGISRLKELGFPVLIGHSRKSFISGILGDMPPEERLAGSLAAGIVAAMNGCDILRVHDVRETAHSLAIIKALTGANK